MYNFGLYMESMLRRMFLPLLFRGLVIEPITCRYRLPGTSPCPHHNNDAKCIYITRNTNAHTSRFRGPALRLRKLLQAACHSATVTCFASNVENPAQDSGCDPDSGCVDTCQSQVSYGHSVRIRSPRFTLIIFYKLLQGWTLVLQQRRGIPREGGLIKYYHY